MDREIPPSSEWGQPEPVWPDPVWPDPVWPDPGPDHGGRLRQARLLFPHAPEPFIDLSTGINPVPYPLPHLARTVFARLPEPEDEAALRWEAASAYHAPHEFMVACAPGTQSLIGLLPRLWPARHVAVIGPTYAEHALAWRQAGARITETGDLEQASAAECVVLCNPNNPDGRRHTPDALLQLADLLAARGGLLVVDEAFADLDPEALSLAPSLPHPAIVVLRSFGKTYGLAGVRLGFALAAPERIRRIRAALGPWPVSGPALVIGRHALSDRAWLAAVAQRLRQDGGRLDQMLTQAGLTMLGGTRLFRLGQGGGQGGEAARLFTCLGEAGILVRRFPERPDWLRFGLPGLDRDWGRLATVLNADPFCGVFTRRSPVQDCL